MSDINQTSVKNLGLFSVLDTAMEVRFFFLAATFILWVDNDFLCLHQPGIIELVNASDLQNVNLSLNLVLIFVAFSFASSIVLPFLSYFINEIYLGFLWRRVEKVFKFGPRFSETPSDYVSAYKLREIAYMTKDKFLLDVYNSYEKTKSERERFIGKLASLALYCLILLSINYFKYGQKNSISFFILSYLGSSELIWFCIMGLLLLVFFRFHTDDRDCVYCPSLYRELEEKKRQSMPPSAPTSWSNTRF